ncbi:MAG: (d)CMP kinase [Dehalococcoidia bacterium]|nr:(d)CMP kinase [Dehalococcoidia bacterium]
MTGPPAIAIDGPVASGKSSVGQRLANRLGRVFIDTGMMYRACAWLALRTGVPLSDERALIALITSARIDARPGPQGTLVYVNGENITPSLRDPEVERAVSTVAAIAAIRQAMVREQRRIAGSRAVIMAGRDIGTVVLPDAPLKVYLDASVTCRARRRAAEMDSPDLAAVEAALAERDRLDSERNVSPLRPATDAVIIQTDAFTLDQVVERIADLAHDLHTDPADAAHPG